MAQQERCVLAGPHVHQQRWERGAEGGQRTRCGLELQAELGECECTEGGGWRGTEASPKVRITSQDTYAVGSLWITDVVHVPYGED